MIRHGVAPFLECSSRGDRRFSALFAQVGVFGKGFQSIERHYQASKILPDGSTGLTPFQVKGIKAVNQIECAEFYSALWDYYVAQHPDLLIVLQNSSGLSDMFGQAGRCCQATELWRIRNQSLGLPV